MVIAIMGFGEMVIFMIFCLGTVALRRRRRRSSIRRRPPRRPRRIRRQLCLAAEEQRKVQPRKKRTSPPRALTAASFRKWIHAFHWKKLELGKCDSMQLSFFKIGQVKLTWIQCEWREPQAQCINIRKTLVFGDAHFLAYRHHRV